MRLRLTDSLAQATAVAVTVALLVMLLVIGSGPLDIMLKLGLPFVLILAFLANTFTKKGRLVVIPNLASSIAALPTMVVVGALLFIFILPAIEIPRMLAKSKARRKAAPPLRPDMAFALVFPGAVLWGFVVFFLATAAAQDTRAYSQVPQALAAMVGGVLVSVVLDAALSVEDSDQVLNKDKSDDQRRARHHYLHILTGAAVAALLLLMPLAERDGAEAARGTDL